MTPLKALAGFTAAVFALAPMLSTPAAHAPAPPDPVTVADLADSGPQQQGWISAPASRVTLNPGNPQFPGLKGSTIPASTEYFAYGAEGYQDDLLQLFQAASPAPVEQEQPGEGTAEVGYEDDFDDLAFGGWTTDHTTASAADGTMTVTTSGNDWGKVASKRITVDLSAYSMLSVKVDAVGPAGVGRWALKIQPETGSDRMIQEDISQAGTFDYDLSDLSSTGELKGETTFSIYLFVSGGEGRSAQFDWLRLWGTGQAPVTDPEAGQQIGFADDFGADTAADWSTDYAENNGATYTSTADGGVVTMPGGGWGAVARKITVDVDRFPALSLRVASTSGKWALKLSENGRDESATLQRDTAQTGVATFDIATATGWSGTKTFYVKLYQIGDAGSATTFNRLSVHTADRWLTAGSDYTSTWQPDALAFTVDYGADDAITGFDVPVGVDGFGRSLQATSGTPLMATGGAYRGAASWDAETARLTVISTVGSGSYTWVVQLPQNATVRFFTSRAKAVAGSNAGTSPAASSGYWVATLPGASEAAIGVGFAMGTGDEATSAATAAARAADTSAELAAARAGWAAHYDAFLATVPVPQDFDLHAVADEGVTAEQLERLYYTAWVGLEANTLAPTPETGGSHWQIATGKPSTYASGPQGSEASAEWDSLLGAQFMVYVRPDLAWDAYAGNLEHAVPAPGTSHETLPSRKAQTAWILYQVTGDRGKLDESYSQLSGYLNWAADEQNMKWSYSGKGDAERDAEFYVSMIVDLAYGQKIARLLGHEADAQQWGETAASLVSSYQDLFFPESGVTLYKHWIDGSHPDDPGLTQYVTTGLHAAGLDEHTVSELIARFRSVFDTDRQLAGLASENPSAIKAPDIQFVTYGLLDQGMPVEAEQVINIMSRDIVRAGVFAEVYSESAEGPRGGSVAPSLFGNIHLIDNLWMMNGVRMDLGEPSVVRLPHTVGGMSGLTHLGRTYSVDIREDDVVISGEAVQNGLLSGDPFVVEVGQTVTAPAPTEPTEPGEPGEPGEEPGEPGEEPGEAAPATVTVDSATVRPGDTLRVTGTGLPGTRAVEVWLHSTPTRVATDTTSAEGTLSSSFRVPADTALGEHRVEVRDAAGTLAWSGTFRVVASDDLAATGGTIATGVITFGVVAALAGWALIVAARRRRAVR